MDDFLKFVAAIVLIVVVVFAGIYWVISDSNSKQRARYDSFTHHCFLADGHLYTVDYESWCLTNDGRIIEVYP